MRSLSSVLAGVVLYLFVVHAGATEVIRMLLDLDGDGSVDRIDLQVHTAKEEWRRTVVVKVASLAYESTFFAADGDTPTLRPIHIDRKRRGQELLLTTIEPGSCVYHFLAYRAGRLALLLRHEEASCKPPQELGNGIVQLPSWQGFWTKEEDFQLSFDGLSLTPRVKRLYPVNAVGSAGPNLVLDGAECPPKQVPEGTYLRIASFDAAASRYRVEAQNGACGWLPANDVKTPESKIRDLPWAG